MKKSVKDYLREIEKIYKMAALEVATDHEELINLREERSRTINSKDLTDAGKNKKLAEIDKKIKTIQTDMHSLRDDANNRAKGLRKEVENHFWNYYHANSGDVDMQMVALINAGVLSDTELFRMSETANTTMKRMIGRALENSKSGLYVEEGRKLQEMTANPHMRAVDGLIGIGDYACGGARLSGTSGAKAYINKWDELVSPIIESAPNVSWNMDILKPGEITYSED